LKIGLLCTDRFRDTCPLTRGESILPYDGNYYFWLMLNALKDVKPQRWEIREIEIDH
jgi:hypothetical protein